MQLQQAKQIPYGGVFAKLVRAVKFRSVFKFNLVATSRLAPHRNSRPGGGILPAICIRTWYLRQARNGHEWAGILFHKPHPLVLEFG